MFLTQQELENMGLKSLGHNVLIDRTAQIFGPENLRLASNVRIDANAIISCPNEIVEIGNHVHIGVGVTIFGASGVEISDFAGMSPRSALFSETDDFASGHLTGPTVPKEYRKVKRGKIKLGRHVVVGFGSVVMPGVNISDGAVVGALSFVSKDIASNSIVVGVPSRMIGVRNSELLLELETKMMGMKNK